MKYLFEPRGIAIIGASHNTRKLGYLLIENILAGGYPGKIYPVNPRGGEILGLKVYPDISSVDGEIDVAAIVIPAENVLDAVRECVGKRVRYGIVITSGFSDVGRTSEENEIAMYARANGMRILGPNVLGYYSAASSLNLTFGMQNISPGPVAVISQSGGLGVALTGMPEIKSLGLSAFFSVGNKSDIDDSDLLEYITEDGRTRVVIIYMEGIRDGYRFVKVLKKLSAVKPVIIVKSGGSEKGARAAASHTGSLACPDDLFAAVMKQCNVLRTDSLHEAIDWAAFFARVDLPRRHNTLVITNGGGLGVIVTDAMEKRHIPLYDCQDDLKATFEPIISRLGSFRNPVDITSDFTHETFSRIVRAGIDNGNIDAILIIHCQVDFCDIDMIAGVVAESYLYARSAGKILIFTAFGNESIDGAVAFLRERDVPVFDDFLRGVSCLDALYAYCRRRAMDPGREIRLLDQGSAGAAAGPIIDRAAGEKRGFLLAGESAEILKAAGIGMPERGIAFNENEAAGVASKVGYPVAMKIVSPDILHKTDAGGVVLNVKNREEAEKAFNLIRANCLRHYPGMRFAGIEVCRMEEPGLEMIIGARRDAVLGPVVMCGLGGIYVEVLRDVSFLSFPATKNEISAMLRDLKSYPLLAGTRGKKPVDIGSVTDTVIKVGEILLLSPLITDIELNPVFVYEKGLKAVDSRIMIRT